MEEIYCAFRSSAYLGIILFHDLSNLVEIFSEENHTNYVILTLINVILNWFLYSPCLSPNLKKVYFLSNSFFKYIFF